jgi:putative IMPACT (imprinted ancient) family translation regulator
LSSEITYRTIKSETEILHRDRGSKFWGYAYEVRSRDEAKTRVDALWERYPDATHVCYAFILGLNGEDYRANDDGEPGNSAGQPILREIKSAGLTNTLVAVVRFYGGKKLGVPGLIDAYGTSARMVLEASGQEIRVPQKQAFLRELMAKDYLIYEYVNRFKFIIVAPPDKPGGYFTISCPLHAYEALVNSFGSLPNFELTDDVNS